MADEKKLVQDMIAGINNYLENLDELILSMQKQPNDLQLMDEVQKIFTTIHSTVSFYEFNELATLADVASDLLNCLIIEGVGLATEHVSNLLSIIDALRDMLGEIKSTGVAPIFIYADLVLNTKKHKDNIKNLLKLQLSEEEKLLVAQKKESSSELKMNTVFTTKVTKAADGDSQPEEPSQNFNKIIEDAASEDDMIEAMMDESTLQPPDVTPEKTNLDMNNQSVPQGSSTLTTETEVKVPVPSHVEQNNTPQVNDFAFDLDDELANEMMEEMCDLMIQEEIKSNSTPVTSNDELNVRNKDEKAVDSQKDIKSNESSEVNITNNSIHNNNQVNVEISPSLQEGEENIVIDEIDITAPPTHQNALGEEDIISESDTVIKSAESSDINATDNSINNNTQIQVDISPTTQEHADDSKRQVNTQAREVLNAHEQDEVDIISEIEAQVDNNEALEVNPPEDIVDTHFQEEVDAVSEIEAQVDKAEALEVNPPEAIIDTQSQEEVDAVLEIEAQVDNNEALEVNPTEAIVDAQFQEEVGAVSEIEAQVDNNEALEVNPPEVIVDAQSQEEVDAVSEIEAQIENNEALEVNPTEAIVDAQSQEEVDAVSEIEAQVDNNEALEVNPPEVIVDAQPQEEVYAVSEIEAQVENNEALEVNPPEAIVDAQSQEEVDAVSEIEAQVENNEALEVNLPEAIIDTHIQDEIDNTFEMETHIKKAEVSGPSETTAPINVENEQAPKVEQSLETSPKAQAFNNGAVSQDMLDVKKEYLEMLCKQHTNSILDKLKKKVLLNIDTTVKDMLEKSFSDILKKNAELFGGTDKEK